KKAKELGIRRADGEVAVRRAQRLVGRAEAMRGAEWLRCLAGEPVFGGLPYGERHRRLEERRVDVLALAGLLAVLERAQDAVGAEEPRREVGERDARLRRRALLAGDADDAAHPLRDEVIAAAARVGAGITESGDRAVHEPWVYGF